MNRRLSSVIVALPLAFLLLTPQARAQDPRCPPEWHCEALPEDDEPPADEGTGEFRQTEQAEDDQGASFELDDQGTSAVPPPPSTEYAAGDLSPSVRPSTPPLDLLLRATGTILATQQARSAGMRGVGLGLRWHQTSRIAYDLAIDALVGSDVSQRNRRETVLSAGVYSEASPRRSMALGMLAGVALSAARVQDAGDMAHVGGYVGGAVRFRLTPDLRVGVQLLGVLRRRIASDSPEPEFVDPASGLGTDTSAAGLLRISAAFRL